MSFASLTTVDNSTRRERDRGSGDAMAFVLIFPALVAVALLVVAIGRQVNTKSAVRTAAESAAQAAALETNHETGELRAQDIIDEILSGTTACELRDATTIYVINPDPDGVDKVEVTVKCGINDHGLDRLKSAEFNADISAKYQVTAIATIDKHRAEQGG